MAAKGGAAGTQSLNDALMDAAQAITRAMGTAEASNPSVAQGLSKLLTVTVQMARHGGGQPQGGGAAPGAAPGAGTPAGAGMGPPGAGAANPMMGTPGPPPAPGGPGPSGMPQMNPDELRRLIGANT